MKGGIRKMSSQIEEIEKLYAKEKVYKIPKNPKEGEGQAQIKVKPLAFDDMGLVSITEDTPPEEATEKTKTMIAKSLGIDETSVAKFSIKYMEDIMAAISDANNFKEEDVKKTGIKDFLEKKRQQIAEAKVEDGGKPSKPTKK